MIIYNLAILKLGEYGLVDIVNIKKIFLQKGKKSSYVEGQF